MIQLPSRQVHLDFHTSEHIPGVGAKFDKKQFQAALKAGHVNSITVFAKCHHSWAYYPTAAGMVHPTLQRDLLGEQIAACHEIGVRAPIYFTVGWSATDAARHRGWITRHKDGSQAVVNFDARSRPGDPRPTCSWKFLSPNGAYLKLILAQVTEICERYDVDGLFFDICFGPVCYNNKSVAEMKKAGLDPKKPADAAEHHRRMWLNLMVQCNTLIATHHPEATVFYNGGANAYAPQWHGGQTHFELEDLPTTWGGYDKFPLRAKFFANTGKQFLAMSGKFHTSWGEFGGFKNPDAIRFEAAAMIAFGSRCSFGDQLHPSGEADMDTYRSIGAGYRYAKRIEPYGLDGRPASNLGVYLSGTTADDQGTANILLETQRDFEVVDPEGEFNRYETIILPGARCLDPAAADKLAAYVKAGGSLLVLGESAMAKDKDEFLLPVGAKYLGPGEFDRDYTVAGRAVAKGLVKSPFLNYCPALRVQRARGVKSLAAIQEPYFSRTYAHYCSHQNTPHQLAKAKHPAAWQHGRIVCLAHRLGQMYYQHGARVHRQLFDNALRLVYKKPVLEVDMPSAGRVNLVHQPARNRYCLHLLYGPPIQRGRCLVIEDLVPIHDVPVTLRVAEQIKKISLAPTKKALPAPAARTRTVHVTVPEVQCHQIVVFEYGPT